MFSWLKRGIDEDTVEAQNELIASDKEWQKNLKNKGLDPEDRRIEMGKNYKALTNCNTQELRDITCTRGKDSPRPSFNNAALTETKDLLDNQTETTKPLIDKEEVKETLEEERSKKRGLFW